MAKTRITKRDIKIVKEMADRAHELHVALGTAYANRTWFGDKEELIDASVDLEQIQKCSDHLYAKFCR